MLLRTSWIAGKIRSREKEQRRTQNSAAQQRPQTLANYQQEVERLLKSIEEMRPGIREQVKELQREIHTLHAEIATIREQHAKTQKNLEDECISQTIAEITKRRDSLKQGLEEREQLDACLDTLRTARNSDHQIKLITLIQGGTEIIGHETAKVTDAKLKQQIDGIVAQSDAKMRKELEQVATNVQKMASQHVTGSQRDAIVNEVRTRLDNTLQRREGLMASIEGPVALNSGITNGLLYCVRDKVTELRLSDLGSDVSRGVAVSPTMLAGRGSGHSHGNGI